MTRLFEKDGLLSKLTATVLFVTHLTRWESIADNIITLDNSGKAVKYFRTFNLQAEV